MHLVIVESPAKAKTINSYLGKDYKVLASYGHITQLASKAGSVDPENDFNMDFTVLPGSLKYLNPIISEAKKCNSIILATDPDREGEAISWHIIEAIKSKKSLLKNISVQRIVFSEISKKSILNAISNARDIDIDLVNAQKARQALDYLVGFTLSPVLWKKLPGCKSAGRVQSVALRLITDREEEIDKFISQEYWDIGLEYITKNDEIFSSMLTHIEKKKLEKFSINNKDEADLILEEIKKYKFRVDNVEKKSQQRNPYPPFITSTLQQEASRKLGFSAKKTMQIAQKLYEGFTIDKKSVSLITYMRTDGVTLSKDSIKDSRDYIIKNFGDNFLPKSPRIYKSKSKNAQEAHEAIRPVNINLTPEYLSNQIESDYLKLYELIWKRTLACQMSSAKLDLVVAKIISTDKDMKYQCRANGSRVSFEGFYKVYKDNVGVKEDNMLPELNSGDMLDVKEIIPKQHFTEPQPRYSEASLVKNLEERGIGRPSTYANIISVLQDRKYVRLEKKRFFPEERGRILSAFLVKYFEQYVEYDFTAELEDKLDRVANKQLNWKILLEEFWKDFIKKIDLTNKQDIKVIINSVEEILSYHLFPVKEDGVDSRICPSCKTGIVNLRLGKFGAFLACSSYPECKYTKQIIKEENNISSEDSEIKKEHELIGKNSKGEDITLRVGPYGKYLQLGEGKGKEKPKRATIPSFLSNVTIDLQIAEKLLSLPLSLGVYEDQEVKMGIGRYGPYILYNKKFISIPKKYSPLELTLEEAEEIILNNQKKKV